MLRDAGVIRERPDESLLIEPMLGDDLFAFGVRGFRVVVILADEIGGEAEAVVGVRLAVRHAGIDPRGTTFAGFVVSEKQLIPEFVVTFRFVKRDAVVQMIGKAMRKQ